MENKIREYVEGLFEEAPQTRKALELREEMVQNMVEKYQDLLHQGKTPEMAYNMVIGSIGDVGSLLRELRREAAPQEEAARKRSALFVSIAIALYILSVVPILLLQNIVGVVLMFVFAAAATGLLVYHTMSKPRYQRQEDSMVEDFKEWQHNKSSQTAARKAVSSAIWAITVAIYLIVSFTTFAWHITWVIFLIAGAVNKIADAAFALGDSKKEDGKQ